MINVKTLRLVKICRLEYQRLRVKADYIRVQCESGGTPPETQTGKTGTHANTIEYRFCELAEAEDMAALALRRYRQAEQKATDLINLLEDDTDRDILRLKYLDFLPTEKIAEAVGYSAVHCWRRLTKALKELSIIKPGE